MYGTAGSGGQLVAEVREGGSYHWPGLLRWMAIVGGVGVGLGLFTSTRSAVPQT